MSAVFCLSIHAGYGCRHAGACCEMDWHIPAEPRVVQIVDQLKLGAGAERRFVLPPVAEPGATLALARRDDGSCVFFERPHAPGRRRCCPCSSEIW